MKRGILAIRRQERLKPRKGALRLNDSGDVRLKPKPGCSESHAVLRQPGLEVTGPLPEILAQIPVHSTADKDGARQREGVQVALQRILPSTPGYPLNK